MKLTAERAFANPEAAARKLVELAATIANDVGEPRLQEHFSTLLTSLKGYATRIIVNTIPRPVGWLLIWPDS
ncbi:hypothetical protein ABIF63_004049 [Bradyrhizobium japonicum]|uniref:Uncharacterized protein n=1 Tax=Bradyrhizobium japonicum TaxID=375 RepID=A0ABV2RSN2_BRAJP